MPDQFDTQLFEELGYSSFIHSATKKGYSGVAILSKITPKNVHAKVHPEVHGKVHAKVSNGCSQQRSWNEI